MTRRVPVLLAALGVAVSALAGCGGPSQTGAAAIVGDQAVSLADVQSRIDAVLARPDVMSELSLQGKQPAAIARLIVTDQIEHLLLADSARREGITVTDDQVDAELAKPDRVAAVSGDALVFDPARQRQAVRDELIAQALTAKYFNRLAVTVDVTTAPNRDEAFRKGRLLAAGPAQANAVLAADGPTAQRNATLRAAQAPSSAALFLFGTPAGRVVILPGTGADVWTLVRFTRRGTDGPPQGDPAAATPAQLGDQLADEIGRRTTQPLAEQLGVRVNPRYGTWDPVYLGVLPPDQETSVVLTATTS